MTYKPDGERITKWQIAGSIAMDLFIVAVLLVVAFGCGWLWGMA